jgi:hypothetical protein
VQDKAKNNGSPFELITDRPALLGAAYLIFHLTSFVSIAIFCEKNLPLDVIEQVGWARDPQWVYFKHPPLPAWVLSTVLTVGGHNTLFAAAVGPIFVAVTLWILWVLARRVVDPVRALASIMLLEGVIYFNATSLEFNHNVVQMPLWAAIGLFAHRALRGGRVADWAFLGAFCSLGMLGKYSTILLIVSIFGAFVSDPAGRRQFRTKGPWVGLVVALAVIAPHFVALYRIDFQPFRFPLERSAPPSGWFDHIKNPARWFSAQLLDVAFALLLTGLLVVNLKEKSEQVVASATVAAEDRRFVWWIAFGPLLITLAMSVISGRMFKDMWGMPMANFIGLALVSATSGVAYTKPALTRFIMGWMGVFALAVTATALTTAFGPWFTHKGDRLHFPGRAMASRVHQGWNAETGGRPLRIAIGDSWIAGLMSAYDPDHPSVMIDGDPNKSPWITPKRLAEEGAVIVWRSDGTSASARDISKEFPGAKRQPSFTIPFNTAARVPPVTFSWAILPPASTHH